MNDNPIKRAQSTLRYNVLHRYHQALALHYDVLATALDGESDLGVGQFIVYRTGEHQPEVEAQYRAVAAEAVAHPLPGVRFVLNDHARWYGYDVVFADSE